MVVFEQKNILRGCQIKYSKMSTYNLQPIIRHIKYSRVNIYITKKVCCQKDQQTFMKEEDIGKVKPLIFSLSFMTSIMS